MPRLRLPKLASVADALNRSFYVWVLALLTATFFRHFFKEAPDPYKCEALLRDGQWLDSPDFEYPTRPFQNWQPPGCILHEYRASEIANCAENGKILFVGDASIRQIFWETAKKIDRGDAEEVREEAEQHQSFTYSRHGINLRFIWDPFLNSTELYTELEAYRDRAEQKSDAAKGTGSAPGTSRSVVMLIGAGLWHARHLHIGSLKYFKDAIDNITTTAFVPETMKSVRRLPLDGKDGIRDQIFFAPLVEPQYEKLSPARELTVVPGKIHKMNGYLEQLSLHQGLNVLWSYSNMTLGQPKAYGESGLHVVDTVAGQMADVLLNLRCNAKAARREGFPYGRTCCNNNNPLNWIQVFGFVCALLVSPVVVYKAATSTHQTSPAHVRFAKSVARQRSTSISTPSSGSVAISLYTVALCVCYCYVADRTQIFSKVRRQYTDIDFFVFSGAAMISGILTLRNQPSLPMVPRRRSESFSGTLNRGSFLSRNQTDEWKGWMQIFILVYGYTGASNQLEIYEVLRILLASYLFLTGYGHTMYFLQKTNYSLQRAAAVLVRLNILTCLLSYMMVTAYTFYYFVPLVSFWFLVIFITLRIRRQLNDSLLFLMAKVILSALLLTGFILIPGILETLFFALRAIFNIHWNVSEWRARLSLDSYIAYVGVLVAVLHIRISTIIYTPQPRPNIFVEMLTSYFFVFRFFFTFVALIIIPVFWIVTRRSPDKADYNWWMPSISWLPIVSFVILRNSTSLFRRYHSAAFAWVGRVSLESYVLSYHILLAGDGKGLLSTGLFKGDGTIQCDRWRDLILTAPIFVWMSWRVAAATSVLTVWIVDDAGSAILPNPSASSSLAVEAKKEKKRFSVWPKDLKKRLGVMVMVMCFLNWTYT